MLIDPPLSTPQRLSDSLFLGSLPRATAAALTPHLERVNLAAGELIAAPGVPIAQVLFPIASVVSTVLRMSDGEGVEVGITGRDGVVGAWLAMPDVDNGHEFIVQISGAAFSMSAGVFARAIASDPALHDASLRWTQAGAYATAQFIGCNRLHPVNERYARWLLMACDRVGDRFRLTQEYAGQMLGVRRATVTLVAGELSRAGLIAYHRGDVRIIDRKGLEEMTCECYGVVNVEATRLLGFDVRDRS